MRTSGRTRVAAVVVVCGLMVACTSGSLAGGDAAVDGAAVRYDQTCSADTDCVAVPGSDPCCGCLTAGIRRSEESRYRAENVCNSTAPCANDCAPSRAVCQAGRCAVTSSSGVDASRRVSASDYDRSCVTANDCVVIQEGDPCNLCSCPAGAIHTKDLSRYRADFVCSTGPAAICDIACPERRADCRSGICAVSQGPADASAD